MKLKVTKLHPDTIIPTRGSAKASGLDLYALEDIEIGENQTLLVRTGIAFGIPDGYEIQIRPRSGLSLKTRLRVTNSPGTIDQDYVGECCIIMYNGYANSFEKRSHEIKRGDRIAQAVLCPVVLPELEEVTTLEETTRGVNGFGSSGV